MSLVENLKMHDITCSNQYNLNRKLSRLHDEPLHRTGAPDSCNFVGVLRYNGGIYNSTENGTLQHNVDLTDRLIDAILFETMITKNCASLSGSF